MPTTHDADRHDENQKRNESDRHVGGAKLRSFVGHKTSTRGATFIVILLISIFCALIAYFFILN